jgi:hypothetical protein
VEYFLSGSKGFHGEIPKEMFGADEGDAQLPMIFKMMAAHFKSAFNLETLDMSLYSMGKGHMFRLPNVKRKNGFHKIPITLEELRDKSYSELIELAREPRTIEPVEFDLKPCPDLVAEYQDAKKLVYKEIQEAQDKPAKPLSKEEIKRLSKNIPPCVKHIISEMPPKSEENQFQQTCLKPRQVLPNCPHEQRGHMGSRQALYQPIPAL